MFQDSSILKRRHQKFIKTVSENGIVYVLKNKNGFATSSSINFEDEKGNSIGMICFWAEKTRAKSCIKGEWKKYKVNEISLVDFLENWCIGMAIDSLIIGTEFDQNMFGFEAEPLELLLELVTELKSIGKNLNFKKFNGVNDLEKEVKEIIKE